MCDFKNFTVTSYINLLCFVYVSRQSTVEWRHVIAIFVLTKACTNFKTSRQTSHNRKSSERLAIFVIVIDKSLGLFFFPCTGSWSPLRLPEGQIST